jgi:hypothetical protein
MIRIHKKLADMQLRPSAVAYCNTRRNRAGSTESETSAGILARDMRLIPLQKMARAI